jgi:2-keto-3-deoxy-L-rhamnonate aldolase RhmA
MKNRLKEKLRNGGTAIGCWVSLNSPAVTEVLAGAGYDALLIDYEHGEGSVGDLVHHLRAAHGSATTVIVRVPNDSPHEIKRALDCGAAGIMVPGVDSLFLGPMDLSGSTGKLGEFDDPEVKTLRADAERAILATDAVLGTIETAAGGYDRLAAEGYRLIFATSDVALLHNGPAGLTANKA